MSIDNVARPVEMRGKYIVKKRGMYISEIYETEAEAKIVADRWNRHSKQAKKSTP